MLVILNKERKKEIIRELDWLLETIPCSISLLDKLQVRFAVNTDASESVRETFIEKTPLEYFDLRKAPYER